MRSRLTVFILLAVGLVFALLVARRMIQSRDLPREAFVEKKLRILTYATFVGPAGPGPEILKRFEQENQAKVDVVTTGDAGLLLERLKLAQASVPFDVVLGLDQLLLEEARASLQWRELKIATEGWAQPAAGQTDAQFAAIDWSPLSFVYRQDGKPVPAAFDDLLKSEYKKQFALQDPRASTPGLQFFKWVKALKGGKTVDWLKAFQPNVNSVSPSWAFSYGLFKKGQARFVFSYLTSLAYHWGEEKDRAYQVVSFPEGHPVQVEVVGIPASCRECGLAEKFVHTLHSDWAQRILMSRNYMFPVLKGLEQGTVFAELPSLKTIPTEAGKDLRDWDQVFPH